MGFARQFRREVKFVEWNSAAESKQVVSQATFALQIAGQREKSTDSGLPVTGHTPRATALPARKTT